jgi:hypothetical protein
MMETTIEWMRWMYTAASPELLQGLREGRIVLGDVPLLEILRKQAPSDVAVESIELEAPARVVIHATSRSVVTLRVVLPIDLLALRWSQNDAAITYALVSDAVGIEGDNLIAAVVLAIGIGLARLRGSDGATILDEKLATALKAESVPEGRRLELRKFPSIAGELDRTVGGIALWSIVTFDRVECTPTSIVVHMSPETKARAAAWVANADGAVNAGRKAVEVFKANEGDLKKAAQDFLGFAFDTFKGRKRGAS